MHMQKAALTYVLHDKGSWQNVLISDNAPALPFHLNLSAESTISMAHVVIPRRQDHFA